MTTGSSASPRERALAALEAARAARDADVAKPEPLASDAGGCDSHYAAANDAFDHALHLYSIREEATGDYFWEKGKSHLALGEACEALRHTL